jgi:hypothetical protein
MGEGVIKDIPVDSPPISEYGTRFSLGMTQKEAVQKHYLPGLTWWVLPTLQKNYYSPKEFSKNRQGID